MVHCLAVGCSNTYKNSKGRVAFHKLPEDKYRKKQWLANIKQEGKLPNPENCFVCSDHFRSDDCERDLNNSCNSHSHNKLCVVFHLFFFKAYCISTILRFLTPAWLRGNTAVFTVNARKSRELHAR